MEYSLSQDIWLMQMTLTPPPRKPLTINAFLKRVALIATLGSLTGCLADPVNFVDDASYKKRCVQCHTLNGTPTPLARPDVILGSTTCKTVNCQDEAALAVYIGMNMPLGAPELCIDDCARETAKLIFNNYQTSPKVSANSFIEEFGMVLDKSKVTITDESTGDITNTLR